MRAQSECDPKPALQDNQTLKIRANLTVIETRIETQLHKMDKLLETQQ